MGTLRVPATPRHPENYLDSEDNVAVGKNHATSSLDFKQTGKTNPQSVNASHFDHCRLQNVKVYLNSQNYPYGNLNLNIDNAQLALLHDMYARFQTSCYDKEPGPLLSCAEFRDHAPLIVIDCSKQCESVKAGAIDVRLEFECQANIPVQTAAYCLIIHDKLVECNALRSSVTRRVLKESYWWGKSIFSPLEATVYYGCDCRSMYLQRFWKTGGL